MTDQLSLFDRAVPSASPQEAVDRPRRIAAGWAVVDHACRHCGGRVLVRLHKGNEVQARCAECGAEADGDHTAVCSCGEDLGALGKALECFRNPNVTREVPYQILVRERVMTPEERERRVARPVRTGDL